MVRTAHSGGLFVVALAEYDCFGVFKDFSQFVVGDVIKRYLLPVLFDGRFLASVSV